MGIVCGDDEQDRDRDDEPDEAPETPLDEPRPPHVEDPPAEPGNNGPYVVGSLAERRGER